MAEENSISNLLTVFLYKNGYLSLPELGKFEIAKGTDLSDPDAAEFNKIPKDGISFHPNKKEGTDEELIKFITDNSRKMQSLAVADLFTLADQTSQMLNIYQPVTFPGIGTIQRGKHGEIEFVPGEYRKTLLRDFDEEGLSPKFEGDSKMAATSVSIRPERENAPKSFKGVLVIILSILIAAALLYFLFTRPHSSTDTTLPDTVQTRSVDPESSAEQEIPENNTLPSAPAEDIPNGMIRYEVVFEKADRIRALRRDSELTSWGHTIIMRTTDSVNYTLAVPFISRPEDTTRVKDSIKIFFGRPTSIYYPANK